MVPSELYLAFIGATLLLCVIPGPVVTYLVAVGIRQGWRDALIGLAGCSTAITIHMVLVVASLDTLLVALGPWTGILQLIGAAYIVWLGISAWRTPITSEGGDTAQTPRLKPAVVYRRGLLVSITNPKTLIFYAAFFPQFIAPDRPALPQLLVLALTFITISALSDGTYAIASGHLAPYLKSPRAQLIRNRITGIVFALTGLTLALTRS
ncbi:LysE family translocator [Parvibaculum sedimenti]|uniref:LysE family translocator n=1 Tax=Parvibaculum sedimenti TaxID=2608632 RepID=A0A6N6VE25_9HYPH|nr:LysE family translocator [Parvibaculum sedimenti]KAB7738499.1 LysE family translocator [Parvibaculum sedimenti]